MKAVLLAAGLGTRLRPLTDCLPKCLVPIGGRPLLDHWLDRLLASRGGGLIEEIWINTHHLPDQVAQHMSQSPWRHRLRRWHEPELLGTGGTVHALASELRGSPFLVAHADNFTVFDPVAFWQSHQTRTASSVLTMMTFETDSPQNCGIVEVREGLVRAFHEKVPKPPSRLANAAVYWCEQTVLDELAMLPGPTRDISTELIPKMLGRMSVFHNTAYHRDIGTPESLVRAQQDYEQLQRASPV